MKHLISLKEQSKEDLLKILHIAHILKTYSGDLKILREIGHNPFAGKRIVMLLEKNSTRTKLSFEAATQSLSGHCMTINAQTTHSKMANPNDELRAMMTYCDILVYRALDVKSVESAAALDIVPVVDACSNKYHPAQALSDIFTMSEISGGIKNIGKVVWLGIENNVSNTLVLACHKLGIHIHLASPVCHKESTDEELLDIFSKSPFVHRTHDLKEALSGANYVHTDTWMDMEYFDGDGKVKEEFLSEFEKRKELLMPYQISAELLQKHNCDAKIMHCMPCHEGYEITRDAIDHQNSVIFHQAENRYHLEKGILWWMLEK